MNAIGDEISKEKELTEKSDQIIFDRGTINALMLREILRLRRDTIRWIALLIQPILFWFVLGKVFGIEWKVDGVDYSHYFFPGTLMMIILFTSIGTTMSLIEDRSSGFFQGVLIAPGRKFAVVLGKVFGVSAITLIPVGIVMLLAPYAGVTFSKLFSPFFILFIILNTITLTSMGFCLAWMVKSTQSYHSIMNLLFFPLWGLSGALYPLKGVVIDIINKFNPMYYGVIGLRASLEKGLVFPWKSFLSLFIAALLFISFATLLCYRVRRTVHE